MGILNVTPDSFSDGGRYTDVDAAVRMGVRLAGEGADLVDVGGESTRPGAEAVPAPEEIRRTAPVIARLRESVGVPLSIDTRKAAVAERAIEAGAGIVNDVTALRSDPGMGPLLAETGAPVILMHMLGTPREMQVNPTYTDVVAEIMEFLDERIAAATNCGIAREQIVVDPGFGFGKTLDHNLELLRRIGEFQRLDRPVLVGTSRKSMIGAILDLPAHERLHGTLATVTAAVERGAAMVRVHDVRPAVEALRVLAAIHGRSWG